MKRFLLLLAVFALGVQAYPDITVTIDPSENPDYVDYSEWRARYPGMGSLEGGPRVVSRTEGDILTADEGLIALVVDENLETELASDIARYIIDLETRGYVVELSYYSITGKVEDLKDYLANIYTEGLVGAVLVGNLPCAWFQMINDWDNDRQIDTVDVYIWDAYTEFPCDMYLCDLDGEWGDDSVFAGYHSPMAAGTDGIYDSHTGSYDAEIWVSRIDASNIWLQDANTLYHSYFDRIHSYRQGELVLPSRGLFFIDHDWRDGFYDSQMALVCNEHDEIRDTMITDADNYELEISEDGLYVTVCAHSSPEAHYFHKANDIYPDMFRNWEISQVKPKYGFYNLFACSNCRWVETNCMGSVYPFFGNGLASVGSSKTGSMLFFQFFNIPLSNEKTWGEAMRLWTNQWMAIHGDSTWARSWFMGMCVLGDGALSMGDQNPIAVEEQIPDARPSVEIAPIVGPEASLRITLPAGVASAGAHVRLEAFDATGRLADIIYDGAMASSSRSYTWDTGSLAPGVYFVRLSTQGITASRKVVITR